MAKRATPRVEQLDNVETFVGIGFVRAVRVNDKYAKIINNDGSTYAIPMNVFSRTCAPHKEGSTYTIHTDDEGLLWLNEMSSLTQTSKPTLWKRFKDWASQTTYRWHGLLPII